jgi:hypothetical protein
MQVFVPLLIVLAVLYVCDVEYNRGAISDGIISMGRFIIHSMGR